MNKSIDIKAALQFGWDTLRANVSFFLKVLVALIVLAMIPAMILGKIATAAGLYIGIPLQFLNLVWQSILGMGVLSICLKLYDQKPVEISDLWSCIPKILDYIIVKFAYSLIVGIGLVLLIIPGLIWTMQFYLASYLVVDRGTGAIAALKGSSAITHGVKWDLGVFASVLLGVNIIGILCLGIGLMITLPMTMLASVFVYRKLLTQTEAGSPLPL
jgi:uncharacterized membrane protein